MMVFKDGYGRGFPRDGYGKLIVHIGTEQVNNLSNTELLQ